MLELLGGTLDGGIMRPHVDPRLDWPLSMELLASGKLPPILFCKATDKPGRLPLLLAEEPLAGASDPTE